MTRPAAPPRPRQQPISPPAKGLRNPAKHTFGELLRSPRSASSGRARVLARSAEQAERGSTPEWSTKAQRSERIELAHLDGLRRTEARIDTAELDEAANEAVVLRDDHRLHLAMPLPSDFVPAETPKAVQAGAGVERVASLESLARKLLRSVQVGTVHGYSSVRLELDGVVVSLEERRGVLRPTLSGDGDLNAFARRLHSELARRNLRFDRIEFDA